MKALAPVAEAAAVAGVMAVAFLGLILGWALS